MKSAALLLCTLGVLFAQQDPQTSPSQATPAQAAGDREGNYEIRFEPSAKLQSNVQIPFDIRVNDARHKPLQDGKVTLQIEMADHSHTKVFRAPAVSAGVYVAKPVFPLAGQWNVYVEVRRDSQMSARLLEFSVSQ